MWNQFKISFSFKKKKTKHVDAKTHQLKAKEEDEEDYTGKHGEAQQEHQRLILANAREFAI